MKGVVAYYSKWGNCAKVAEEVAAGLREAGHEVELVNVKSARKLRGPLDFLVAGSGTRCGNMTRPMRKFLKRTVGEELQGKPCAAFGTEMLSSREKDQPQAAGRIYDLLQEKGLKPAIPAFRAAVEGMRGPLVEGDLEASRAFGKSAGEALSRSGSRS